MAKQEVVIVPYVDGPYLVRGPVTLRDQSGASIESQRATIALCRCGKSRVRPFCDGTHHLIRFRAPSQPEARDPKRLGSSAPHRDAEPDETERNASELHNHRADHAPEILGANGHVSPRSEDLLRVQRRLSEAIDTLAEGGGDPAIGEAMALLTRAERLLGGGDQRLGREG
jgi:CDGSH-type Zn-finger protein